MFKQGVRPMLECDNYSPPSGSAFLGCRSTMNDERIEISVLGNFPPNVGVILKQRSVGYGAVCFVSFDPRSGDRSKSFRIANF